MRVLRGPTLLCFPAFNMLPTEPRPRLDATGDCVHLPHSIGSWRVFLALLVITCMIHTLTLTRSPPVWQDEIQYIDYGRTLWPGSDQSYGINWSGKDRPIQLLFYIGCLLQEAAYRLASGTNVGARLSALVGAVTATVALRSWLLAAGISPWIALAAGCGFLWDPRVVSGYRGARIDVWSMAFMFMAFWSVRQSRRARYPCLSLGLAGACIAVSGLTWVSAILLLPLLLYELYGSAFLSATGSNHWLGQIFPRKFLQSTLLVGASAVAAMLLLLLPFHGNVENMLGDLRGGVSGAMANEQNQLLTRVLEVPRLFVISPWLPLVAIGGVAMLGPRAWFVPLIVAICGVIVTRPYSHRAVYLVPYFIYGFAMAADRIHRSSAQRSFLRNPATWLTAGVLGWGIAVSLVGRTINALNDWHRRDPALVERFIHSLPGGSSTRVLLGSWNLYYPIRSRNWRYWGPLDLRSAADIASSLDYDYVIHDESAGLHPLDGALRDSGYTRRVVTLYDEKSRGLFAWSTKTPGYGPYVVYTHPRKGADDGKAK